MDASMGQSEASLFVYLLNSFASPPRIKYYPGFSVLGFQSKSFPFSLLLNTKSNSAPHLLGSDWFTFMPQASPLHLLTTWSFNILDFFFLASSRGSEGHTLRRSCFLTSDTKWGKSTPVVSLLLSPPRSSSYKSVRIGAFIATDVSINLLIKILVERSISMIRISANIVL